MNKRQEWPATLIEVIRHFSDWDTCREFMVALRWPDGVVCPTCGRDDPRYLANARVWECRNKHPRKKFSLKTGTIFEDSPIGFDKWLPAMWMLANDKNGISSYELARALGVTQKTGWFMLSRIRLAMEQGTLGRFVKVISGVEGKRLTYAKLTGKTDLDSPRGAESVGA